MKQYFLKTAGLLAVVALMNNSAAAQQDDKPEAARSSSRRSEDVIIIRPKTNVDTKVTIEVKGDDVIVNGKPLADFKNDDIKISRQKSVTVEGRDIEINAAPRTRFREPMTVYGYGGANSYRPNVTVNGMNMNANKAFLGVGSEDIEGNEGVRITSVTKESAAEKAGLKEGDIITKINDTKIGSPGELTKAIGKFNPDDKITVTYKRDKKEQKVMPVLTKNKTQAQSFSFTSPDMKELRGLNFDNGSNYNFNWNFKPRLGLKAQETEDGKGLKVLDVDDESTAEKAGIKEGDIITSFDGTEVNTVDKLGELAKTAIEKGTFKIKLNRDGKQQEIEVKIPKKLKSTNL